MHSEFQPASVVTPPEPEPTSAPNAAPPEPTQPIGIHPRHQHHGLLPAIQSLFYIIVIASFIITFILQPFRIPSGSMEPTLLIGDFLLVSKQAIGFDEHSGILPSATIHRGEIVIFHYPVDTSMPLIKRVVGLPGDHVRLRDNHVYINGSAIPEPYAVYRPSPPEAFRDNFPHLTSTNPDVNPDWWIRMRTLVDNGELIIPVDSYFVLGDNRNNSEDSRYWGLVPRSYIVGQPLFIYFSLRQDSDDPSPGPNSALAARSLQPPSTATPAQPHHWYDSLHNMARWDRFLISVN